jgi:hypothetical protein
MVHMTSDCLDGPTCEAAADGVLRKSIEKFPYDDEAQRLLDELESAPAPGPTP